MTALTNSSGMTSFSFRITELFCVGTMRANSKGTPCHARRGRTTTCYPPAWPDVCAPTLLSVAGTTTGVSTVFPVDRSTSRVYFKVQLPDIMRVGADGPYVAPAACIEHGRTLTT